MDDLWIYRFFFQEYEGERNNNDERHGLGKGTFSNGDTYEGRYEFGKRHGPGTYRFKSAGKYVGEYSEGRKHGQGTFWYPDGSRYEGGWVDNQRNGFGVYYYSNGDIYEGDWYEHQRHGQGTYTYVGGGAMYKGSWVRGKRHGSGKILYSNHRFIGNFLDDLSVGSGKFQFDIGCEQLGEFKLENIDLAGETEEDEVMNITVSKWKCSNIQDITQ